VPVRLHSNGTRDWKGVGVESSLRLNAAQYAAVNRFYRRELTNAAAIEQIVRDTQREVGAGTFSGWQFKMKTEDSLCRKVAGELRNGANLEAVLGNIKDIHRFTVSENPQYFVDTVQRYQAAFANKNLNQIKETNTFAVLTYKGINTVQEGNVSGSQTSGNSAQSSGSNGSRAAKASLDAIAESTRAEFTFRDQNNKRYRFEMQFHTPASLAVKEAIHPIYEAQRALTNDPGGHVHNALNHMLYRTYEVNNIRMPARIEEIGNFLAPGSRPSTPASADWQVAEALVSQQLGRAFQLERVAPSETFSNSSMNAMVSSFSNSMSLANTNRSSSSSSSEDGLSGVVGLAMDVASQPRRGPSLQSPVSYSSYQYSTGPGQYGSSSSTNPGLQQQSQNPYGAPVGSQNRTPAYTVSYSTVPRRPASPK
jgi:hypothetical protein